MENLSNQFNKHTDPDAIQPTNSYNDLIRLDDCKMNGSETQSNRKETLSDPIQKQKYMLQTRFPIFTMIDIDFSEEREPNYRKIFLEDLERFTNQEKSRSDFLEYLEREYRSSEAYSSIKAKILELEGKEKEREINHLLKWYTEDGFLQQIIADALKIGTWDAIFNCRWIIQSLNNTIKEHYQKQANSFSGILCSEVLINDSEWEKLKKGIGKDIQLYGFLSGRKIRDEMIWLGDNNDERTFLSIIVPSFPDIKAQKIFAELGIRNYDKHNEEFLFNIMSKFRILEANDKNTTESSHRHLVLIFGDDEIQKFIKTNKPIIEVKIDKTKNMRCLICASNIDITQASVFYVDLCKTGHYACETCIQKNQHQSKSPLLCVYSPTQLLFDYSGENNLSLIFDGCATQYHLQDQNIPFYGYMCLICRRTGLKCFYKCLSCRTPNKSLCNECMNGRVECVEKGHLIILEGQPFTFWSNDISDMVVLYNLFRKFQEIIKNEGNFSENHSKSSGLHFSSNIKDANAKLEKVKDDNVIAFSESNQKGYQNKEDQEEAYLLSLAEYIKSLGEDDDFMEKLRGKDLRVCLSDTRFEQKGFSEFIEALEIFKNKYYEEIIVSESLEKIHEFFFQEIIWYNHDINSQEIPLYKKKLETYFSNIKYFIDWKDARKHIEDCQQSMQIILSGVQQEDLIEEILPKKNISCIFLFGDSFGNQQKLAKKYKGIRCFVFEWDFEQLKQKIKFNLLRQDFPAFTPIFDDMHKSDINHLHIYLNAFVNFHNRRQSKRDFLTLARRIFSDRRRFLLDIEEFEETYNKYEMVKILKWYTRASFLSQMLNNCLRLATVDSILCCRLILSDIQRAIKEGFQKQRITRFNGVLYRAAFISDKEWLLLQENIRRDIEMLGFLSTTKSLEIANMFLRNTKRVLIKIIVPPAPNLGEQGFIDLSQISDFSEEEVLFNVMSRFTILEADGVEKNRNLVLLYGAQEMKIYTKLTKPIIEVIINNKLSQMETTD